MAEIISEDETVTINSDRESTIETRQTESQEADREVPETHSEVQTKPKERIFKKKRGQAKAGANIFVEVTHIKAKETPHTFTLVNGEVV